MGRRPRGRLRVELPATETTLPNGLRVFVLPRRGLPEVAIRVYVDAGRLREARPGAAALTGACLDEGAGGRSATDIADLLAGMGAQLGCGAGGVSARCLSGDVPAVLEVVADLLRRPDFAPEVVERKRGELIAQVRAEDDDPSFTGRQRLRELVYGSHPLGRRDKGGEDDLRALTRDDVLLHHRTHFVPRNTIVAIVGDVDGANALDLVRRHLGDWEDRPVVQPALPGLALGEPREVHVEEDRDQLHIYLGHLGIRRDDPDYHALLVGDYVLGAGPGFTDRLSRTLRDEQGLAYTVGASLARSADLEPGLLSAYIGTSPDTRERAIEGLRHEITALATGAAPVTDTEIEDAQSYMLGSYVFAFETNPGTAEQIVQLARLGLPLDEPDRFVARIAALEPADVQRAIERHVHPGRLVCVTVGRGDGR